MHIIVTGANGYIAKNLLLSFNSKHKLTILSRKTNDIVLKKKNYLKFDLRKKIPNLSCDILIHAAGITPHGNYSSEDYNNINFLSLKNILQKIKIKKKIIFFSTTEVYRNQYENIPLKENKKIDKKKISDYAVSKYNCENFLRTISKKKYPFKKIILRLPGIVGKNNHKNFISELTKNIILKKKLVYYGGDNLFNNIYHIDTLVRFIKILIKKTIKKNYEIINIGTNNPITINQIIKILNGKLNLNNYKVLKKKMFTINVTKLNKYYKVKTHTKNILKKYLKEKLSKK
jgi:UDP-glucose 4-epimerase